jgi:hypothetical protein
MLLYPFVTGPETALNVNSGHMHGNQVACVVYRIQLQIQEPPVLCFCRLDMSNNLLSVNYFIILSWYIFKLYCRLIDIACSLC